MKRAIILHGTEADSSSNWFPWLKDELEQAGWEVWVPDLPGADRPNARTYTPFILEHAPWSIDEQVTLIGHSSGAVEILHLLQNLPNGDKAKAAILVGAFTSQLATHPDWRNLTDLFLDEFDFELIKSRVGKFIFIHSEDDPHCPIEQTRELAAKLDGEFIAFKDKKHFSISTDPSFDKFPELLPIIERVA